MIIKIFNTNLLCYGTINNILNIFFTIIILLDFSNRTLILIIIYLKNFL
jgi:hypothetical protein